MRRVTMAAVSSWPQTPSHATSPAAATTIVRAAAAAAAGHADRGGRRGRGGGGGGPRGGRPVWGRRGRGGAYAGAGRRGGDKRERGEPEAPPSGLRAPRPVSRPTHGFHANAAVVADSGPVVWYSHHAVPSR